MGLETYYYTLIHRLTHWCSIQWQKKLFYVWQILNNWKAGQLPVINSTFLPSAWNFLFTSLTHSSNKTLSIHLFLCDWYLQGSFLMFLKHLGFFTLPITNIGSLLPTVLAAAKPVILILLCLPPEHFSVSTENICLVNIDKTTWIHGRCKYSQDRN